MTTKASVFSLSLQKATVCLLHLAGPAFFIQTMQYQPDAVIFFPTLHAKTFVSLNVDNSL
jgi:hypothetical protein